MKLIALTLLLPALAAAEPARAPAEWSPVRTNEIARWKSENGAPDGVVADLAGKSVRFLAEATGVRAGDTVEFLAIGPLSDRAYESLLVTVASPAAIAAAFDRAGIPRGIAADPFRARLWPFGEKVAVSVKPLTADASAASGLSVIVKDTRAKDDGPALESPVVWTGGTRDAAGQPVASTNIPCAVFALYNHAPSLLQLDGMFDQTSAYGRFAAASDRKAGDLFEVTATRTARMPATNIVVSLTATNAAQKIESLKSAAKESDVHAQLAFDESVTVERAATVAQAFELLDGNGLKMNGRAENQFYFRAFLPDPAWRSRPERIFQPFEVHVAADGAKTFVFCEEDWSGEGTDPVLKPKTTPFKDWSELPALVAQTGDQGTKVTVLFLFAPKATPVTTLTPVLPALNTRIGTYYVFGE